MRTKRAGGAFLVLAAAALVGCDGGNGGGAAITCDLAVLSVDAPDGCYDLTGSLSVSISTYNYGPDDCPSYSVALYLSHDIFIRALEDTLIGSESRTGGLASGATDGFTGTVSWSGVPQGSYYVGMIVTCANDSNTLNNAGYDLAPVLISPGGVSADLYDDGDASNGFTPTTVSPGEGWSAWCDVRNGGDGDAGAFSVDSYASLDKTITTSDHLLGSVFVSSGVSVGSYADVDLVLSSFPSVPGGTYYVGWIIDADDDVFESDESNNTTHDPGGTLTVVPGDDAYEPNNNPPSEVYDLSARQQTWLSTIDGLGVQLDNDCYEISVTPGYGNVIVDVRFTDADGDINVELYDASLNLVGGSCSISDDEYLDLVVDPAGGTYYVLVLGENAGNTYDLWWDGLQPPSNACDLAALSVDVPDGPYGLDGSFVISYSTHNYGPDDCPSYTVAFYLSTDAVVTASDTLIAPVSKTEGLASGATDDSTCGVGWANAAAGTFYLGMIVTYGNDPDAGNNTAYDPTPITFGIEGDDLYEYNDFPMYAYYLGSYGNTYVLDAYIDPAYDLDWFYVDQRAGFTLTIDLTNLPDDYDLNLCDEDTNVLASSLQSGTADESITYTCTYTGYYYICVHGPQEASSGTDAYRLTVQVP